MAGNPDWLGDAIWPLQQALVRALKADSRVRGLVGERVYDRPPANAVKPYLSFGPAHVLPDRGQDVDGSSTRVQIDGWCAGPGSSEAKRLGPALRRALDRARLDLGEGQALINLEHEQTLYLVEPDGITQHVVTIFRAQTEPVASDH